MSAVKSIYDIRDYGAVSIGGVINTAAINQAIVTCSAKGGGEVLIAGGHYDTGTIRLKSNVTLRIEEGAGIVGSPNIDHYEGGKYPLMWSSRLPWASQEETGIRALITADDEENIGIEGSGIISGADSAFGSNSFAQKPMLVNLSHCRNVNLRGVHAKNPSFFSFYLVACSDVRVDGISVESRGVPAGDGLDFDGGENIAVSNCRFNCGDDGISIKGFDPKTPVRSVSIANCLFSSEWAGVRIGPESACDMSGISVRDCTFINCRDGIKVQNCGASRFEHMSFSNLTMREVCRPIFVTLSSWGASKLEPIRPKTGTLRKIKFESIKAVMRERMEAGTGHESNIVMVSGLPLHPIENISFHNIQLVMPGGGTAEEADFIDVPDFLDDQYPEVAWLKRPVPASCMYLRHVVNSEFAGVDMTVEKPDGRPFVLVDDLKACELLDIRAREAKGAPALIKDAGCEEVTFTDCRVGGGRLLLSYDAGERSRHDMFRRASIEREKSQMGGVCS